MESGRTCCRGSIVIDHDGAGFPDRAIGIEVPLARSASGQRLLAVLTSTVPIGSDHYSDGRTAGAAKLVGEASLSETVWVGTRATPVLRWR